MDYYKECWNKMIYHGGTEGTKNYLCFFVFSVPPRLFFYQMDNANSHYRSKSRVLSDTRW